MLPLHHRAAVANGSDVTAARRRASRTERLEPVAVGRGEISERVERARTDAPEVDGHGWARVVRERPGAVAPDLVTGDLGDRRLVTPRAPRHRARA